MPYRAERNIRPPEAAAPVREIRPSVPDKRHAPAHSSSPKQFQSFYELYKQNYVINEYIGLANASSVATDMTNDLVQYLEGKLDCDKMLTNWQGYLDNAGK